MVILNLKQWAILKGLSFSFNKNVNNDGTELMKHKNH